jgi:hypothetical protein
MNFDARCMDLPVKWRMFPGGVIGRAHRVVGSPFPRPLTVTFSILSSFAPTYTLLYLDLTYESRRDRHHFFLLSDLRRSLIPSITLPRLL